MSTWRELKRKVQKGLYVDNLRELRDTCLALIQQQDPHSGLGVTLFGIFHDLYNLWDEEPLDAQKVAEVEGLLIPAINKAIGKPASLRLLNHLGKTYGQVRKIAEQAIRF